MTEPSIIWRQPAPYSRHEVLDRLRKRLTGRVKCAFLFGSYARGTANADSDVDVLIVCPSARHPTERFKDFVDLYEDFRALDLVVYTPEEWVLLQASPNTLILAAQNTWVQVV